MIQPTPICPHCHKPIETHIQFIKPSFGASTGFTPQVVRVASGATSEVEQSPIVLTIRTPKFEWTINYAILALLAGMLVCLGVIFIQSVSCAIFSICLTTSQALILDSLAFIAPTIAMWRFLDNSRYEVKQKMADMPKVKKDTMHYVRVSEQTSRISSRHVGFVLPKPITPDDLKKVAIAMQGEGASFSRYYLTGKQKAISERSFYKLSHLFRDRGLAEKVATNRVELTRGGKALLKSYLPPKTNSDDIATTNY